MPLVPFPTLRPPPNATMPRVSLTSTGDFLKIIKPFVRQDEDPEVYLFVFNGMLDNNFECNFRNYLSLSADTTKTEVGLHFLVNGSARWISDHAALTIDEVPGSIRHKILHFNLETDEHGSSNTFSLRKGVR